MADQRKAPAPPPRPPAPAPVSDLPTTLTPRVVAGLTPAQRLDLYNLKSEQFAVERPKPATPEDLVNYSYGNFFADLHGPPAQHGQAVKTYVERIMSEGWEPVWWHAPLVRDINAGGLEIEKVVSVRLRARRLRPDVNLKRTA